MMHNCQRIGYHPARCECDICQQRKAASKAVVDEQWNRLLMELPNSLPGRARRSWLRRFTVWT